MASARPVESDRSANRMVRLRRCPNPCMAGARSDRSLMAPASPVLANVILQPQDDSGLGSVTPSPWLARDQTGRKTRQVLLAQAQIDRLAGSPVDIDLGVVDAVRQAVLV